MTVVNPKSISGINSITTGSGSDDILTIHTNNGTERLRVDSTGATKIVTGIVTTLTATTGIVTTLTTNTLTANSTTKVGSGVTLSPDGDVFFTGIATGNGSGLTALNASNISSGTVPTARLGSGTASSSTFLRGDSTFATPTTTTINNNADNRLITGSGTANTLDAESTLLYDSTTLTLNKGGLTNAQKLIISGSGNSSGDDLTFNNWGNADGDYWTIGVNLTANSGGSTTKTDTELRHSAIIIDGRLGRIMFSASETSTATQTETFTFNRNGDLDLTGNLVPISGKGIDFGATANGGSAVTSELLADYEEGRYSPTLTRNSSNITYTYQKGRYIRVGNLCFVWFDIQTSGNNSSGSGTYKVSLPFSFATNSSGSAGSDNAGHGAPSFRDMSFFTRDQGYKTSSYINGSYIELRYINNSNNESNMIETGSNGRVTGQAWGYLSQAS